jgi:tetratricopeptide (TPR) repeat protein
MNIRELGAFLGLTVFSTLSALAQTPPPPSPVPAPTVALSDVLSKNLDAFGTGRDVSRDRREQAYAKLLEGQRYIWSAERLRSQAGKANSTRLARQAIQKAVELDPMLAEGYTALAEIAVSAPQGDIEEPIRLASLAVKVNPNNFGSRRLLARLYTLKSRLNTDSPDKTFSEKALAEWKLIAQLDPRNAEAWAFQSEILEQQERTEDQINALRKWLSAASPIDSNFYRRFMGGDASLSPERASLKLGAALLKVNRTREAIEVLSVLIADDPDNYAALDLLRTAVESANPEAASIANEALQQAVASNPANVSLISLLARVQAKSGRLSEAAKLLDDSSQKLTPTDRASASVLLMLLGDLYRGGSQISEAVGAYERSLKIRGLDGASVVGDDEREFAMQVYSKIIETLKSGNRSTEVKVVIDRARKLFGDSDLFADRQLISYHRENGRRNEALTAAREARKRASGDYGLLRLEATLLAEIGKVDEAVAMVKALIDSKTSVSPVRTNPETGGSSVSIAVPNYDDFTNYLFISQLYAGAGRGKEAADAANQAYTVARGSERKQLARLTLATAKQRSGDFSGAEATLREILKESPGNPIALNNLGYFLLERGDRLQEALELIQQAVAVDPTNPSYLDSLGWAYYHLGKTAEAEKQLREAARLDSSSATIHEHLGDVYRKTNRTDLARASWQRALELASEAGDIDRLKKKLASGSVK